jgi:amino acid transporter
MSSRLWTYLVGSPLPTHELADKRLDNIRALAAFSPDALSSVAYASQEIFLGLVVAGSLGLSYAFPIAVSIVILLVIVAISYYQTIQGYPSGGGSYIVARDNLGYKASLVAATALLIDYLLTAAVSLTAGVEAIASAIQPLWPYRVEIALVLLAFITLLNLRGVRESGTAMAVPVYLFLLTYIGMLLFGMVMAIIHGPGHPSLTTPKASSPLTLFLLLHTFSAGCTALTGVEAISNGVPYFKQPEAKNAGKTLMVMTILMGFLFIGSNGLIQYLAIVTGPQETILSALSRTILGNGPLYLLVQVSTLLILAVAANTSFAGFPRLASILAQDNLLPHQLANLGDRLVFTNGMILLAIATGVLIVTFGGNSHALIPLFAIGAFLAYTLSQAGMVLHWKRVQGKGWQLKSLFNSIGALVTGVALVIVIISKFLGGAWIVFLFIPLLMMIFQKIHKHYKEVGAQLTLRGLPPSLRPYMGLRLVLPVSGVHRGVIDAVNISRAISKKIVALYIEVEPGSGEKVKARWQEWWPDIPIVIEPSPYRSMVGPLLDFLDRYDAECNDGTTAGVVLPEFIPAKPWQRWLHNQQAEMIKRALLFRRRQYGYQRVIIDVPYHLKR